MKLKKQDISYKINYPNPYLKIYCGKGVVIDIENEAYKYARHHSGNEAAFKIIYHSDSILTDDCLNMVESFYKFKLRKK